MRIVEISWPLSVWYLCQCWWHPFLGWDPELHKVDEANRDASVHSLLLTADVTGHFRFLTLDLSAMMDVAWICGLR